MNVQKRPIIGAAALTVLVVAALPAAAQERQGPYAATWEALRGHRDPAWFQDAKLGIYTHWGPITVATEDAPSAMEWYGQQLYLPEHPAFAYHRQKYGEQNAFGYKDLIPLFTAEKFNADEWADLFVKAGAKFAGPVAVHHDNYALWDSKVTRWNSVAIGPRRDITGELEKAYRKRGLKFILTFHHGFAWRYFEPSFRFDGKDARNADLYTEIHLDGAIGPTSPGSAQSAKASGAVQGAPPSVGFMEKWLAMVNEPVAKYKPDLIWFDFELMRVTTPEYQRKMFADYYNWAAANQRESAVAHKFREIQQYTGILDFERGREDKIQSYPWLTDTSLGPWFNHNALAYRTANDLVDTFIDIVSKNGCLLLNVGPHADGRIPERAKTILLAMGEWLRVNGEAIYGTRPWVVYGEGPTHNAGGGFSEKNARPYTADDVRFTTKGEVLYALGLHWPSDGRVNIRALKRSPGAGTVRKLSLLGSDQNLKWTQTAAGLEVQLPAQKPSDFAFALKITGIRSRELRP